MPPTHFQLQAATIQKNKIFEGQLLNRDFYLPYSAIDLLIQDAASDAETAQKIMKPEITATIDDAQYQRFVLPRIESNRNQNEG